MGGNVNILKEIKNLRELVWLNVVQREEISSKDLDNIQETFEGIVQRLKYPDEKTSSCLDDIPKILSDLNLEQVSIKDLKEVQDRINKKIDSHITSIKDRKAHQLAMIIKEQQISADLIIKFLGKAAKELGYSFVPTPKQQEHGTGPVPKFRSPDGRTWTGFGRNPKWMGKRGSSEYKKNEKLYLILPDDSTKYEQDSELSD